MLHQWLFKLHWQLDDEVVFICVFFGRKMDDHWHKIVCLCLNLTAYMLHNSCKRHPFPSGTGAVAMNFCLAGVFENATVECGSSVGVNPQVPNLKMFLALLYGCCKKSILELNVTKHVCDITINIKQHLEIKLDLWHYFGASDTWLLFFIR